MCGIGGEFGHSLAGESMVEALRHRGPDGSGVWRGVDATLVHTRLAILGLGDTGSQPMIWKERAVTCGVGLGIEGDENAKRGSLAVVVFNGEIYNHADLRKEMEAEGERFVGNSDTEVLLRLLVKEGRECLPRLAGMFAFAFWDARTGEGLLARDAYGIKPLYYRSEADGSLAFSSESKVIQREDDAIDPEGLRDFFLWGSVPEPQTLFTSIRQLPAGHSLRWRSGRQSIERWYYSQDTAAALCHIDYVKNTRVKSSREITRAALEESVRRHLVSDVPVGVFLSGGIDSTVVLALVRQELGPMADIRTFSIGFDDPELDESSLARQTAEHFGTNHTEWRMTPEEGAAEMPSFLAAADQASIDGFNTWCVSKLARREGLKVVLSGLGGDEWFAGYNTFEKVPQFHLGHRMLGPLRPLFAKLLSRRPSGSPWRRVEAFLRGGGSWLEAFHVLRGIFTEEEATELTQGILGRFPKPISWGLDWMPKDPRAVVSELEVSRYMRNQLLRDADVFSMAHGLELRVPFVDIRLADALLAIPSSDRLLKGKRLLVDAVPEIPDWIRNQPKRGFVFPFQEWMEGPFGENLAKAHEVSPIPLNTWYRTWAVAKGLSALEPRQP